MHEKNWRNDGWKFLKFDEWYKPTDSRNSVNSKQDKFKHHNQIAET